MTFLTGFFLGFGGAFLADSLSLKEALTCRKDPCQIRASRQIPTSCTSGFQRWFVRPGNCLKAAAKAEGLFFERTLTRYPLAASFFSSRPKRAESTVLPLLARYFFIAAGEEPLLSCSIDVTTFNNAPLATTAEGPLRTSLRECAIQGADLQCENCFLDESLSGLLLLALGLYGLGFRCCDFGHRVQV